MTTPTTTQHATTTRFLAMLAGRCGSSELIELRYRLSDGERMGQLFEPAARLRRLATRAIALGRRTDVYVGCAPRTRRHGGRAAVARAFVLWVDCDGEEAVAALERFEPAPSIVIASGTASNCHAYWPLVQPLARDEIEGANRRLAHALGADPASADGARILRVPGTLSHKHAPPTPVEALRLDTRCRLISADVVGELPDPPLPLATPVVPVTVRGDDPLLAIAPDVYVPRLLGVEVPRHRKVRCPFHADRHASLHVYESAQRGWYCFGRCRRGGTIYDLAGPLYGYGARGEEFLRLRAELVERLILESAISALPWPSRTTRVGAHLAFNAWTEPLTWRLTNALERHAPDVFLRAMLGTLSTDSGSRVLADLSPSDRAEVRDLFRSLRASRGFLRDIREPVDPGLEQRVRCPTLIIASRQDGQVPPSHAERLHQRIPGATLIWSHAPSHLIWFGSAAGERRAQVARFLAEPATRRSAAHPGA